MRLIDADALLREWRLECGGACFVGKGRYCMHYDKTKGICTLIVKAPTIEAEPIKHAHDLVDKARYFYCSECGYAVADVFEGAYHHDERVRIFEEGRSWNYCPNCGAKMDEVEE